MFRKKVLVVCIVSMFITACSMDELSSVNKKISDFGSSIAGNQSSQNESGMPKLAPKVEASQDSTSKIYLFQLMSILPLLVCAVIINL